MLVTGLIFIPHWKIPAWISGNFQWQWEYWNFRNFTPRISVPFDFPPGIYGNISRKCLYQLKPILKFSEFWLSGNCTYSHIVPFVYRHLTCYGDGEYLLMAWMFFLIITSVNLLMIFSLAISHMNTPFFAVAPHIQLTSPANFQN